MDRAPYYRHELQQMLLQDEVSHAAAERLDRVVVIQLLADEDEWHLRARVRASESASKPSKHEQWQSARMRSSSGRSICSANSLLFRTRTISAATPSPWS
jgi:hypothetical protein